MKTANMTKSRGQVYSVGNYLMSGKVLGKGHFARVEEATHRIVGRKVAIKVIDLTSIKEEYARRNLHREPRVMARLRHPCIAALYETMMYGPRLYVVMEAAGGGDLCAHVLGAGDAGGAGGGAGGARGLPEGRARSLAAQLVSAVRHMHARGVVHRDLKMENIMLDSTKQFIKIVDFGLSNLWSVGGGLRTPCGSLEYAAPELFVDGRKYGPEVDLWSIGVIVFGMVTGGLPFAGAGGAGGAGGGGGAGGSRSRLRAAIARGFTRTQRTALAAATCECKAFIQHLLEPKVELRMRIEEAARHRWIKKPGLRMKTHPFGSVEPKSNRELYKQISELCGQSVMDVVAQIKADPFGAIAGIYNIKTHLHQMQGVPGADLLWSSNTLEPRPPSPPEYQAKHENDACPSRLTPSRTQRISISSTSTESKTVQTQPEPKMPKTISPRSISRPYSGVGGLKTPVKMYDSGDTGPLPSIHEHSIAGVSDGKQVRRIERISCVRKVSLEEQKPRLNSCPNSTGDKRAEFYRRAGDGFTSWQTSGAPRVLVPHAAGKRASMGNIISPHSSTNSHCKSERAMPVGWYSTRSIGKEITPLQRLRRTAPIK